MFDYVLPGHAALASDTNVGAAPLPAPAPVPALAQDVATPAGFPSTVTAFCGKLRMRASSFRLSTTVRTWSGPNAATSRTVNMTVRVAVTDSAVLRTRSLEMRAALDTTSP